MGHRAWVRQNRLQAAGQSAGKGETTSVTLALPTPHARSGSKIWIQPKITQTRDPHSFTQPPLSKALWYLPSTRPPEQPKPPPIKIEEQVAMGGSDSCTMQQEQPLVHQYLLRLRDEAAALDTDIKAAVGKMEAAKAEGDEAGITLYRVIYDNLVARERELNAMRAALTTALTGRSVSRVCRSVEEDWLLSATCHHEKQRSTTDRKRGDSPGR